MAQNESLEVRIRATYDDKGTQKAMDSVSKLQESVNKRSQEGAKVNSTLTSSLKQLAGGFSTATSKGGALKSGLSALTSGLSGTTMALGGTAVVIGGLVVAFNKFLNVVRDVAEQMSDLAWAMDDMASRMGGSFDNMTKLYGIAKLSRLEFDKMSTTVEVLDLKMSMLQTTEGRVGKAMKQVGIDYQKANGEFRDTVEVFDDLVEAGAKMDRVSLSAFATDIFGRLGAANFIRQVKDMQEKMEMMQRQAGSFKPDMSGWLKIAKIINEIRLGIDVLKAKFADMFLPFVNQVYPAVRGLIYFLNNSEAVTKAIIFMKTQMHLLGILVAWLIDVFVGLIKITTGDFVEGIKNMSGRVLFHVFEMSRGIIEAIGVAISTGVEMVSAGAKTLVTALSDMAKDVVDLVVKGINGVIGGIESLLNSVISGINKFLSGINTVTGAVAKATKKEELATDLKISKKVSLTRANGDKFKAGIDAVGNVIGDNIVDSIKDSGIAKLGKGLLAVSKMDNPFSDWIPEGSMLDDFKIDPFDPELEYKHRDLGDEADKAGKKLKDLGEEVGKQTQAYKVLYGAMFGSRQNFFNLLGTTTQPSFGSYDSAGITYATTGGLTGITIQNMNVRDERDIQRIAEQLDKLQKKDSRKKGTAYGF